LWFPKLYFAITAGHLSCHILNSPPLYVVKDFLAHHHKSSLFIFLDSCQALFFLGSLLLLSEFLCLQPLLLSKFLKVVPESPLG